MAIKVLSALETSKITVPAPSDTTDAVTKGYVDNYPGVGGGSVDLSSIVPEFSSSKTYPVNSFVSYNGKIYKCSTAVSTAGAFTGSTNWTESPLVVSSESSNAVVSTTLDSALFSILGIHISKYQRIVVTNVFDPVYASYPSPLYNELNGCYVYIPYTRSPSCLEFDPTLRGSSILPENSYTYTPEIIISCDGSNGTKGQKFNFEIVDSSDDPHIYLGSDPITELERGYTYFIVARQYFTYNSSGSIVQKWVLNVQGKVENPT